VTAAFVYLLLVAALVVRVRMEGGSRPVPILPGPGEPVWLVRVHHVLLLLILAGAPLERLVFPGAAAGRAAGAALFGSGVVLYRLAGRALGPALSPFVEPRHGVALVTRGLYRYLRHPMYLSQALIAVGAPLTLGCRLTLALAVPALLVLTLRTWREEQALARTFPEYARYAAETARILPFVC